MKKQSGFSLIGILLAIVITAVVYYFVQKSNFSTLTLDKKTKKILSKQGIKTNNYKEMIDTTKSKIAEINKKIKEREKKLQEFGK